MLDGIRSCPVRAGERVTIAISWRPPLPVLWRSACAGLVLVVTHARLLGFAHAAGTLHGAHVGVGRGLRAAYILFADWMLDAAASEVC